MLLFDGAFALYGVGEDVAEDRSYVAQAHKAEQLPVREKGEGYAVFMAGVHLFREDGVQRLVAGVCRLFVLFHRLLYLCKPAVIHVLAAAQIGYEMF